jgi:hypothetical protein
MNTPNEYREFNLEELTNCAPLKRQFAYEIFCRKGPLGMEQTAKFEAAQDVARRIYPFDVTQRAALYIAGEWIKDPIVIDTLLQLETGIFEGEFLPSHGQFATSLMNLMCEIEEAMSSYTGSKQSPKFKGMKAMRRHCIETSKLMSDVMGWNAERQS